MKTAGGWRESLREPLNMVPGVTMDTSISWMESFELKWDLKGRYLVPIEPRRAPVNWRVVTS